jgi:hypothetical protein
MAERRRSVSARSSMSTTAMVGSARQRHTGQRRKDRVTRNRRRRTFERSVFVNCPFDSTYLPLLRPLLFTIIYLGFIPRIALESLDSGRPRLEKIIALIKQSRYAIHDLSRCRAERKGEYFRLNMPFELGIDVGCRLFRRGDSASKKCLILEAKRFRYQIAISDLSGSDIAPHHNRPRAVVSAVRNWINGHARFRATGPTEIWNVFNQFMALNFGALRERGFSRRDIQQLSIDELIHCMRRWVARR